MIQGLTQNRSVAVAVANTEFRSDLVNGQSIDYVYNTRLGWRAYTQYADQNIQETTATSDKLLVNQALISTFKYDITDRTQNASAEEFLAERASEASYELRNNVDSQVLANVTSASYDIDDGDIGGTAGNDIALTTSNCYKTFSKTRAKLASNGVEDDRDWYVVVSPDVTSVIEQSMVASGFNTADDALANGYKGKFGGFKIYESNNVLHTQTATLDTVIATDVLTVAGVTFTVVAAPSAAGEVDLGASDAATAVNLAAAINNTNGYAAGAGSATAYFEVSDDNRNTLNRKNVVATASGDTVILTTAGTTAVSSVDTTITVGDESSLLLGGRIGNVHLVMQKEIMSQVNQEPKSFVKNYLSYVLFGTKMFAKEGSDRAVEINIAA